MSPGLRIDPGEHSALIRALDSFLRERGVAAWATGGYLRDTIMGRAAHDIDVAVAGDPLAFGPDLAAVVGGHFFPLREERGQARIVVPGRHVYIDLMPLRADDIMADLRLRDFTIDALAAPLAGLVEGDVALIDPTDGLADLRAGIVRMAGPRSFADDPLRLLRGPRIATELAFAIEPATAEAIRSAAPTIVSAAPERQRDEIVRICSTGRAGDGFRLLDSLGLFSHVFPEMEATRGVEQPKEHHFDVLGHSFATVEALDWLMAVERPASSPAGELWEALWPQLEWCGGLREYFDDEIAPGTSRRALLKLCGLLHDIAKPQTKSFEANGRMRFFGHSEEGAEMAAGLMRRLRFSGREVQAVSLMIDAHLRPVQLGQQGPPSRRAIYRFFRDTGEVGIETLFLSMADHLGSVGPRINWDGFRAHVALTSYVLRLRFGEEQIVSPPRLVDGDELMAALAIEPGPLVGELLEAVREAQAAGEVGTKEQALELARKRLAEQRAAGPQ